MGAETIGATDMINGAESFGFNDAPPIDLPGPAKSVFPTNFTNDLPKLAQSSIGQNDVQASPLQMALVAAGVANQGKIMKPHVMTEIRDTNQNVVTRYDPSVWTEAISPENSDIMRQAMIGVVENGTATAAPASRATRSGPRRARPSWAPNRRGRISGWSPSEDRRAIRRSRWRRSCSISPGDLADATGGERAGPIVRKVLEAALEGEERRLMTTVYERLG